ncbi:MAG TPA: YncE family protein [Rhizomicrobium sp.]|nr:YncE family protein [Rhizomicrobium sp.]
MIRPTLLAAAAVVALTGAALAVPGYHQLTSVTLGGDTFWDAIALDSVNHHLFITHGDHVVVVDSNSYAVAGDIPGVKGAHQVAVSVAAGRGFATSGQTNSVIVFDAASLKVTGTIAVGTKPDGIVYEPITRRIFTFNAGSSDSTVIDVASGTVDGTIKLGGKPEFAVADGAGHIFDNIEDTSEVVEIDARTMELMHRWPLAPCESPSGIAYDRTRARLFMACENQMMAVVNAKTGKVITTLPTGKGADGAAYDPVTRNVFIPNGEGFISVFTQGNGDKYSPLMRLSTQFGARTIEIDAMSHRIFTVTADLTPDPGKHPPYKMAPGSFRLLVYGK